MSITDTQYVVADAEIRIAEEELSAQRVESIGHFFQWTSVIQPFDHP